MRKQNQFLNYIVPKHKCEKCSSRKHLTHHHKLPVSKGGTDDPNNIQVLCRDCHNFIHNIKPNRSRRPSKTFNGYH